MNCLKNTSIIQAQTLKNVNDEINKNMVNSINENLNKMKKIIKNVRQNKNLRLNRIKK